MREQRRVHSELGAQRAERRGRSGSRRHRDALALTSRSNCGRERAGLHRADAHHADTVCLRGGDDGTGTRRFGVPPDTAGRVEQIGDRLHDARLHVVLQRLDDRSRKADSGDAPRADAAATLQIFERRDHLVDVLAPRCREAGALVVAVRVHGVVFADVAVQEVDVDVIETHRGEARVERLLELRRHRPDARRSELALGGDANAGRQSAAGTPNRSPLRRRRTSARCRSC